ncbi:MAG: hypothetical protein ACI9ES_001733, partial [Oceanospirillaceae bacterium]
NSEVKRFSADGSVGSPHVRVGHCQAFIPMNPKCCKVLGVFSFGQHENMQLTHPHCAT